MNDIFLISDTHFGHKNMLTFTDDEGKLIRPFNSVQEMDMVMVENWNKVVKPQDKVYHLGDVAFTIQGLHLFKMLNGRKRLVRGNHDGFKRNQYLTFFDEIYGVRQIDGYWFTHIPMHPFSMNEKVKANVHGHLHKNKIPDKRYVNVCVENINYTPISFEEIKEIVKNG